MIPIVVVSHAFFVSYFILLAIEISNETRLDEKVTLIRLIYDEESDAWRSHIHGNRLIFPIQSLVRIVWAFAFAFVFDVYVCRQSISRPVPYMWTVKN